MAYLESNEQDSNRKKERSKSSSSEVEKKHRKKHKIEEIEDEEASSLRKFTVPELTELKKQQMNDAEEEGEIKD